MTRLHSPPKMHGFTLVELLIVISVIGILASIGIIGWGTAVSSTQNKTRESELNQWKATFDLYKARFGAYPTGTGYVCLGNDFPSNKCGINGNVSADTNLNTQLSRVSKLPTSAHTPITNGATSYLGPMVGYQLSSSTSIDLVSIFKTSNCPSGMTQMTVYSTGIISCTIKIQP